jgi:hypothetical protein
VRPSAMPRAQARSASSRSRPSRSPSAVHADRRDRRVSAVLIAVAIHEHRRSGRPGAEADRVATRCRMRRAWSTSGSSRSGGTADGRGQRWEGRRACPRASRRRVSVFAVRHDRPCLLVRPGGGAPGPEPRRSPDTPVVTLDRDLVRLNTSNPPGNELRSRST